MVDVDLGRIRTTVRELMPELVGDLRRLVRIPSVSSEGYDPEPVRRSAEAAAEILERAGMDAEVLELQRAHPAVLATVAGPEGSPTVLLYAHQDVQPPGPEELWRTPPFEPTEVDGRLFGRGSADDKAGVMVHAAAVRAWGGRPPVGVTVFLEGEEESGSPNLERFLGHHRARLRSDAIVLADSANWRIGQPALTTSLRGMAGCVIEIRTLDHAVHSGMYGGPIPDALTALVRTLATLHDDAGSVAVHGLASESADPLDLTEEELRAYAGVRPGVRLIGEGALTERLWTRPSISILAIDAPSVADAAPRLVPAARAVVSLRVPPNQDAERAVEALVGDLERNVPWGAELRILKRSAGAPYRVDARGPAYDAVRRAFADAWGRQPVDIGAGGSIPFVASFARMLPDAALLITGVEDPESNAHSENESLHLGEFARACEAEALFLGYLPD
jgi:acetylornithine deacetylase/succinyl-diaminopimelate desuccinylase-like protein